MIAPKHALIRRIAASAFVFCLVLVGSLPLSAAPIEAITGNLVANSGFETDSNNDGLPNAWIGLKLQNDDAQSCNGSAYTGCSFFYF